MIAKRFREQNWYLDHKDSLASRCRATLATLALDLAGSFVEDNERFDPIKFLDACSPDPGKMPLSELWTGKNARTS